MIRRFGFIAGIVAFCVVAAIPVVALAVNADIESRSQIHQAHTKLKNVSVTDTIGCLDTLRARKAFISTGPSTLDSTVKWGRRWRVKVTTAGPESTTVAGMLTTSALSFTQRDSTHGICGKAYSGGFWIKRSSTGVDSVDVVEHQSTE